MREIRYGGFPQDGRLWRLDWVGNIHVQSRRVTPVVDVQLTALNWEGTNWRDDLRGHDVESRCIVQLSINLWPLLRVGSFWRDGVRDRHDAGQIVDIPATVVSSNLSLIEAYDRRSEAGFVIPPFAHPLLHQMASTRALCVNVDNERTRELIIPCSEIFRAYYGTSSRLAYHLLTGAFISDGYNRIYDPERSWFDGETCSVHLGHRIRNADAQVVSRLAFDPVGHANAQRIVSDTIAARAGKGSFPLICMPPFEARTDLQVRGKDLEDGRFLVFEILRCTAPFPGRFLRCERPRSTSDQRSASRKHVAKAELPDSTTDETALVENQDPGTMPLEATIIDIKTKPVFVLTGALDEEAADSQIVPYPREASRFAMGVGVDGGDCAPAELDTMVIEPADELFTLDGLRASVELLDGVIASGVLRVYPPPNDRLQLELESGERMLIAIAQLTRLEIDRGGAATE